MVRDLVRRIGARWIFLAAVVVGYLVLFIVRPDLAREALSVTGGLVLKVLPVLGIVYGIMLVTDLFIETNQIVRLLGRKSGPLGWILVIAAGILSAGPIYMWYPLLSDFKDRGMRDALIATFLYNRAVKLPLLPMMVAVLGLEMTAIVTGYMVVFSVANGYIVELVTRRSTGGRE